MELQVEPLKEMLIAMAEPSARANINVIPDHITMLHGTKSKKQRNRKGNTKRSTTLTRREFARLGLNTLPTRQMRYEEALPLHRLWKGYMREHLGLDEGDRLPEVHDPSYEAFSKLLVKTDLHGAKLQVIESKCATLVGITGIVVLDTKNVLKILPKDHRIRTVPKQECIFGMRFGNMTFTIFGKHLAIRPAERSIKKIKNTVDPLL